MKLYVKKALRLFFGIFLCALSIVMAVNSNLGLGPWNAFHVGIAHHTSLTLGQVQIFAGFFFVALGIALKQIPGWGTLVNMLFVGLSVDFIHTSNIIPRCNNLISGLCMLLGSLIVMGMGTYFYLSAQIGAGPRDGVMVAVVRITEKPVWMIRNFIESIALCIGILLGAPVGIGTVIYAIGIGYAVQGTFNFFHFDTKKVKHRSILDDYKELKSLIVYKEKRKNF